MGKWISVLSIPALFTLGSALKNPWIFSIGLIQLILWIAILMNGAMSIEAKSIGRQLRGDDD